ncbi:glycosyltransferase family 9 protein [Adhaeribacter aquaticus]|uniref:glycosyltransferase family 9 protein n=1 Tax=Adhaeribacter aquaticus TaxID=299567 RepID=UPI000401B809|nr:glycosyltransferase family 9 protein [Adhaeribacter aquaticus]
MKQKILIIRFSSIGDIVLTTPVIRALKKQLANAEIHYVTKQNFKSIVAPNPYLDKVHYLQENLTTLIEELRQENFDYIVDLHNNLRSRLIRFKLGVPGASFNKLNLRKWLLVNFKINKMPAVHIVDRYLATAKKLGIKNDGAGLDYFIPAQDEVFLSTLPATHQNGYVAIAIGAQHYTKRLPTERIIELCEKINKPILLLGGKEDTAAGDVIAQYFLNKESKGTKIYNACGKFNLNQSASLVRQAHIVYSHDTGLMHVAAAFKKKVVSIWGNTVPEFGMYPYKTEFTVLENNNILCRPCSKIGYAKCPQGHFKCMREIEFNNV